MQTMTEMIESMNLKLEWTADSPELSEAKHRAERYAGWTLPHIYLGPHSDTQGTEELQGDYQALGAQVVNHLANKIVTTLFQPGRPFFRLDLTDTQKLKLIESGLDELQIDELLAKAEKQGMKELTKSRMMTAILTVVKHLIILGNGLIYFPDGKSNVLNTQVIQFGDYKIKRDMDGELVRLITRDTHDIATLPDDIAAIVQQNTRKLDKDDEVTIYTCVHRISKNKFIVWQEIEDILRVPRQIGVYTENDLPWLPLTWNLSRGRNYGTGLVEEYSGDFNAYSNMAQSIGELAALASSVKGLVDPMGQTDVSDLNNAQNGDYVPGKIDDIAYLQIEKLSDANFINNTMEVYSRRIGAAFLFNSAVTRQAERVTAQELRMQAQELEGSLGGLYSRLAEEMQLPIAKRAMTKVSVDFKDVEPVIVTGLESLSRTTELDQVMLFFEDLGLLANLPPEIAKRMNYPGVISKLGAARRVEYKDMLLDEETVTKNDRAQAKLEAETAAASKPQPNQNQQV